MMMTHIPIEQLLRFRHGELAPDEITATAAHLAGCTECAAVAREMFEGETLRTFDEMGEPERPGRAWIAWTAGTLAAVAAAAVIAILVTPRPRETLPTHPPQVISHPAPWSEIVKSALAHGAIEAPPLYRATQMPSEKLRGTTVPASDAVKLLNPIGTVVDTTRPRFEWTGEPSLTYQVTVIDGLTVVARSARTTATAWTIDRDLARGRVYSWQLRIHGGESDSVVPLPPQPPALFAIVLEDASAALAEARRAMPQDPLAIGVLAARAGLREEALAKLQQAAAAHPDDAAIRSMLQSVKEWPAQD